MYRSMISFRPPSSTEDIYRLRAGELANDDMEDALRGVKAERGLHSS